MNQWHIDNTEPQVGPEESAFPFKYVLILQLFLKNKNKG